MTSAASNLERFLADHAERAWRQARMLLGDAHEAEDAVQQALVVAMQKGFPSGAADPWPWFAVVLANVSRNLRRRRARRTAASLTGDLAMPDSESEPSPVDRALQGELAQVLEGALTQLPDEQRDALVLTHFTGLTHSQAAEALDISLGTLKRRVSSGLEKLRRAPAVQAAYRAVARREAPEGRAATRGPGPELSDAALLGGLAAMPVRPPEGGFAQAIAKWTQGARAAGAGYGSSGGAAKTASAGSHAGAGSPAVLGGMLMGKYIALGIAVVVVAALLWLAGTGAWNGDAGRNGDRSVASRGGDAAAPPGTDPSRRGNSSPSGDGGGKDGDEGGEESSSSAGGESSEDDAGSDASSAGGGGSSEEEGGSDADPTEVEPADGPQDMDLVPKKGPARVLGALTRWDNGSWIYAATWAPDGQSIVTGGIHGDLRVWDRATGESRTLQREGGRMDSLAFSPDGKYLLAGGEKVVRWDWNEEKMGCTYALPENIFVGGAAWSPDGGHVAAACSDGKLRVWSVSGDPEQTIDIGSRYLESVAWSPDGGYIAVGSREGLVAVVLAAEGTELWRTTFSSNDPDMPPIEGLGAISINSLCFASDGGSLLIPVRGEVLAYHPATGDRLSATTVLSGESIRVIDAEAAGSRVLVGGYAGSAALLDLQSGEVKELLPPRSVLAMAIEFSPLSDYAFVAGHNGRIHLWDMASGERLTPDESARAGHEEEVESLLVSSDGTRAISISRGDRSILVWDIATGELLLDYKAEDGYVRAACLGPTPNTLIYSDFRGEKAHLLNLDNGEVLESYGLGERHQIDLPDGTSHIYYDGLWIEQMQLLPDGRRILATTGVTGEQGTALLDAASLQILEKRDHGFFLPGVLALSPDGESYYLSSADKEVAARCIERFDVETGELLSAYHAGEDGPRYFYHASTSPDGAVVYGGGDDGRIYAWDVETGDLLGVSTVFSEEESYVGRLAITPDGRYAVAEGRGMEVRVVDLATNLVVLRLEGHTGPINCLAITPDGKFALSAGRDKTIHVWELPE